MSETLHDRASLDHALTRAHAVVHDTPEDAEQLARECVAAARRLDVPEVAAQAQYLLARVLAERGDLEAALMAIDGARDDWDEAGEPLLALRTNLGRMQILDDLGHHTDAVDVGRRMLADLDRVDGDDRLRDELCATAWNNIGVAHSFRGDHDATIDAYGQAEHGYLRLGLTEEAAKTRANRGIELLEVGRAREALTVLHRARESFTDMGDRMWAAKCRGNVAQAHAQLGATVAALNELTLARATLDDVRAHAESARLQAIGARLYLTAGLFREACGEAEDALEFLRTSAMAHDAADASLTCGLAHLAAGNVAAAQPRLDEAARLFGEVGDRQSQARVLLAEAEAAALGGARDRAFALASDAAEQFRTGGWLVPLAHACLRLADLAADPATAADRLAAAGRVVDELRLPDLRYAYCLRRAVHARADGDADGAEALLREAIDIVDRWGATLSSAELSTAFRDDHGAAHDLLVDVLATRATPDSIAAAAALTDRAKASTLRALGIGALGRRWRSTADHESADVSLLRDDLSSILHAMHETSDRTLYATLQRRAADLERALTLIRIEATARDAVAPATSAPPSVGRSERAGPPTIAYHLVGADLLIFTEVGSELALHRVVGARTAIERNLRGLTAQWSRFAFGAQFIARNEHAMLATTTAILAELYDLLVAPVRKLVESTGNDELIVVPHRVLHQVPFAALHDGRGFLGERWAITLAPTVADRHVPAAIRPDAEVVVFAAADEATPAIDSEAKQVLAAWPRSRLRLDAEATSHALRSAGAGASVVHLACHGRYRETNPMFSALRLADRWVTASEVLEFDFHGALVVLSACETGRHATASAEPVGVSWAFLAAGASGAVVSQWLVDDRTTADLMGEFYRALGTGSTPPVALWAAQRVVAASSAHPYYWALFSFVTSVS